MAPESGRAGACPPPMTRRTPGALAALALVLVLSAAVPRVVAGADADALFQGELGAQDALAREVVAYLARDAGVAAFHTGSARFDHEWAVGTYQMSILGLGQVALEHPELREAYLPAMRRAADRLVARDTLRFGESAWHEEPLAALERSGAGHAYLGYVALALGMLRLHDPETRHARLHDRMVAALARRLARAPHALIDTYPGEAYPPDVAAVAGAIGLHERVTGVERAALLGRWSRTFRARWVDRSGYLIQSGRPGSGVPTDAPRGSGTGIAAYFLSFADPALSRTLHEGLARHGRAGFLGFGGIREHAPGFEGGADIDSGPVLLGVGVSATGFALGSARAHGDRETYRALYRTAWLFGVPVARPDGGRRFLAGGPLGNAIMLAMLTARPVS
jgi:hypothetical protein